MRERKEWEKRGVVGVALVEKAEALGGRWVGVVEFERSCCWSCRRVLTTQIGFVAVAVMTPVAVVRDEKGDLAMMARRTDRLRRRPRDGRWRSPGRG